jgi:hypothetical protein
MRMGSIAMILALAFAGTANAEPGGWQVEGRPGATPYRLSFTGLGPGMSYSFECQSDGVLITETGVTQLLDIRTGRKIADEPGSTISPGASFMMLVLNAKPGRDFLPATATPNPVRGWDLSIMAPKSDEHWRALPHAKSVSLMTTGWTGNVELDDASRKLIGGFVKGCGS